MASANRPVVLSEPRRASQLAGELAAQQEWAISRPQLLGCGVGREQVKSWLRRGRLYPSRHRGVYIWGRPELSEMGEHVAGLLFAGMGSALDGLTALWWQGLLSDRPRRMHIASPGRVRTQGDLVIRHPRTIRRRTHRGLPVVDLARSLLVSSSDLSHNSLRLVLARAEYEPEIPFSLPSLQAAIRHGPVGSRALRAAMDSHLPQLARCVNDFERDYVLLCEEFGLPIPEPNVRKGRYVPDMTWEDLKVIVELDGKGAHSTPAQLASDAAKQEWLEGRGYAVTRFRWEEVTFERRSVAARTGRALGR
ncbi:MAG: DUF559 domain-containing protein [Solirubrobacterales bacterium]